MSSRVSYEIRLADDYQQAIERVTAALKDEGFGILTRIDVDKTLKEKIGADFRPYVILGACNPSLAHKALLSEAEAGIMLPCNVTVEADLGGGATVRIGRPDVMLTAGGFDANPVLQEVGSEAQTRLQRVVQALGTDG
jgi:uncharacterized protein (DUF302 family)